MTDAERQSIDRRLARVEGQIRGVRRLISEGAYCTDLLTQIGAAKSALDQVAAQVVAQHIQHCIIGHDGHEAAKDRSQAELTEELVQVLGRLAR